MSTAVDLAGHVDTIQTSFKWEIDDFCVDCKKPAQRIASPHFVTQHVKWQIELYPKGQVNSDGYISMYLRLIDMEIGHEVEIKYSLAFVNDKNEKIATRLTEKRKFDMQSMCKSWGWLQFMKINELIDKKNNLLINNKLIILCEVIIDETKYVDKEIAEIRVEQEKLYQRLESLHLSKYFNNQKFSDIELIVNDTTLYAHRNILANQSPVFAAMFEHDMKENQENRISINDIDYDVFLELLRFLYTGKVNDMDEVATRLVHAADMYGIDQLKDLCADHLIENLSVDNVVEYLALAERYNMKLLKNKSLYFISSNVETIVDDDV